MADSSSSSSCRGFSDKYIASFLEFSVVLWICDFTVQKTKLCSVCLR